MQAPGYKHICGYPLKEDSDLTRCPGCGGKITPWNTQPVAAEPEPREAREAAMCTVAGWLASSHRGLAAEFARALEMDLQGEIDDEPLLRHLHACLIEALEEA